MPSVVWYPGSDCLSLSATMFQSPGEDEDAEGRPRDLVEPTRCRLRGLRRPSPAGSGRAGEGELSAHPDRGREDVQEEAQRLPGERQHAVTTPFPDQGRRTLPRSGATGGVGVQHASRSLRGPRVTVRGAPGGGQQHDTDDDQHDPHDREGVEPLVEEHHAQTGHGGGPDRRPDGVGDADVDGPEGRHHQDERRDVADRHDGGREHPEAVGELAQLQGAQHLGRDRPRPRKTHAAIMASRAGRGPDRRDVERTPSTVAERSSLQSPVPRFRRRPTVDGW